MCRNVTNDGTNADISRDLENEGIELSNEKIAKILSALKQLVKGYYQEHNKRQSETEEDVGPEMQAKLIEML